MGLVCTIATTAGGFAGEVSAGGDRIQCTHGEDTGYYDENNNTLDDDRFPGQSSQNRTGV